ncbi:MAG: hypothetical protein KH135_04195 [Firmicutes bacterium]|nr:hypothetical protein [Bacillota bacterium]
MNHEKQLIEIVKNAQGNLIGIGIDSKFVLEEIEKNEQITNCHLLDSIDTTPIDGKRRRTKSLKVKKFRRKFKKKRTDLILCRIQSIDKYWKYFIRDSVYITKGQVVYYGTKEEFTIEKEEFLKRYRRYPKTEVTFLEDKEGIMIYVTMNDAKTHRIRDFFYMIKDTFYNVSQLLGDYLVQ